MSGLAGYVLQKFEQEWREIYVCDLAVAQAHRRRGIAGLLPGRAAAFGPV